MTVLNRMLYNIYALLNFSKAHTFLYGLFLMRKILRICIFFDKMYADKGGEYAHI